MDLGSVLQVSHGPIFSDFIDKSPNCVKQLVPTHNQRHSTPERKPILAEDYNLLNHEVCAYAEPNKNKPNKETKQIASTQSSIKEDEGGHSVDRKQRRMKKKQNVSTQKKTAKTSVVKEKLTKEIKSTNTEFAPFFTLDPKWPDYVLDNKPTSSSVKKTNSSSLSPSSSALVPKAHAGPKILQNVPSNKDGNSKLMENVALEKSELLKDLQKDIKDIKADINETNSLVCIHLSKSSKAIYLAVLYFTGKRY